MLDLFFRCAHDSPTYAARLIASQADGLKAEREVARLTRQCDALWDWFGRAERRATTFEKALKAERDGHEQTKAVLVQALEEKEDLTKHVLAIEEEVLTATKSADNLMDIADGLRNELKAGKAKKKGRT